MKWIKKGLIFSPSGQRPWMRTHAALPVAYRVGEQLVRVYFASRDERNRSHIGSLELDLRVPHRIVGLSEDCILAPGPLGHFDDHGVYAASLVEQDGKVFMYYIGWNPGATPPLFYSSIGLAVSEDSGRTFARLSPAPILARSAYDPCLVTAPCVILDDGIWRMWYVSGFRWEEQADGLVSFYHIKYAESQDGIQWKRTGLVCIDHKPGERNIARPCVLKERGTYKMWYSYNRGHGYRIGYAESADGYVWTRQDAEAGLEPSPSGWDSEAVAYPWVFSDRNQKYMLYNGNDYGREGFGLAAEIS